MTTNEIINRSELLKAITTVIDYMNNWDAVSEFPEIDIAYTVNNTERMNEIWEIFTDIIARYGDDGYCTE